MKGLYAFLLIFGWALPGLFAQGEQARIDSLVSLLKGAGREWGEYAGPLASIGEPAVPALAEVAMDKSLGQWSRRVAMMTLNDIHSNQWKKPALDILMDGEEDPVLRNQAAIGLRGFGLSENKAELWKLYRADSNEFYRFNLAHLLRTADTALAYQAFYELYNENDGYVQQNALLNLVRLRPQASTALFLDGLQRENWMAANLAMDSLVTSRYFVAGELVALFHQPELREEIQWRIVYIFGHRKEPESIPLLLEAFEKESWLAHTEAAVALCRFEPGQVIPEMQKRKNDPRPYVRNNARWVMSRMQGQ